MDPEVDPPRHGLGSPAGFARWMEELSARVFRFARRRLGNEDEAMDAVQETFLAAHQGLASAPADPGPRTSWLFGIAAHKVGDLGRQRARRRSDPLGDELASREDAAARAIGRVEAERVRAGLEAVPEPFREALVLASVEGLAYAEIAAVQGVPTGTVRSRIAEARRRLRARLAMGEDQEVAR